MPARLDILRFHLARLGAPGLLGAVLLLGALCYFGAGVLPKAKLLEDLATKNAQARSMAAAESARVVRQKTSSSPQATLAPEAAAALRRLYDAADKSGLELIQGEYRLVESREEGIRRYQFLLPVYGSYADVKKFIALALNNEPALALTSVQMRREAIEEAELEVALGFTLYLGAAP